MQHDSTADQRTHLHLLVCHARCPCFRTAQQNAVHARLAIIAELVALGHYHKLMVDRNLSRCFHLFSYQNQYGVTDASNFMVSRGRAYLSVYIGDPDTSSCMHSRVNERDNQQK